MPMAQSSAITLFSGLEEIGMELVDKWEIEGKIHDANRNNINRYFELFEEHIAPKSNALIVIVELKRLFKGSMSLEDFHTNQSA